MEPASVTTPRRDVLVLPAIAVLSTILAFGVLGGGRRIVRDAGERAVRDRLVRESDEIASRSVHELDQLNGCLSAGAFPLPYDRCIALTSLPMDSVQVTIRVEPRNRLIAPDSMRFSTVRTAE